MQDSGRYGFQGLGITTGGPMDCHAFSWANRLLANPMSCSQIEICYGQFSARFERTTYFAITGADLGWQLDGRPLSAWCTYQAKAGAVLTAVAARSGLRGYLAVTGGFDVAPTFGSCSTVSGEGLGGLAGGRPLAAGDALPYSTGNAPLSACVAPEFIPAYSDSVILRVVPGNQFDLFDPGTRRRFFHQTYRVSSATDRMGCRLQGEPLQHDLGKMVSEAVPLGAIQVPGDGLPIILLRDRQTIGGYPKLGSVYTVDLDKLAQSKPGDLVKFQLGTLAEAQAELKEFRCFFAWQLKTLTVEG